MAELRSIAFHLPIVQGPKNVVSDMDGEKVMMNIANGNYYNLGSIGGRIWELIGKPITAEELVNTLMSEYEVEQAVCEEQVTAFLNRLQEEKLIHFDEELLPPASSL